MILITGEIDGDRTKPINDNVMKWLQQFCGYHSIPLLIEANGSRGKPLKAWAEHEPPVPAFVEFVVQVVGRQVSASLLSDEKVHRAEIFSKLKVLKNGKIDYASNVLGPSIEA